MNAPRPFHIYPTNQPTRSKCPRDYAPSKTRQIVVAPPTSRLQCGCSVNTRRLRRHAMSGARYSNHLHAEEAAGSLEALIRDYESRGRRLRVRAGRRTSSKRLPIHHPACLRPARLVNRRCCKQGNRCTASARRLAALTPSSPPPPPPPPPPLPPPPLPPPHHCHLDLPSPHSRLPSWQHPDLAVFFDEALAASGEEVRSLC
jgi:hypothetical protein